MAIAGYLKFSLFLSDPGRLPSPQRSVRTPDGGDTGADSSPLPFPRHFRDINWVVGRVISS